MDNQNTTTTEVKPVEISDDIKDFEVLGSKPEAFTPEKPETENKGEEEDGEEEEDDNNTDTSAKKEEEESDEDPGQDQDSDEEGQDDGLDLTEEEAHDIASQVFGEPVDSVQKKLDRLAELEKQVQEPKFKSERHKKLYEFVNKYSGDDFESGVVRFARLASMDVEKLDPKDAMKELFVQENPELPREKAEKLFEHKFGKQFGEIEDEEIAQAEIGLEGNRAKKKLLDLQKETLAAQTETDTKQYDEQRTNFLSGVEKSFENFEQLTLAIDNDPDSEFNFELEGLDQVRESMSDIGAHFKNMGWVDDNGNYNFEKMRLDYAFLYNKEKILEEYYKHGKTVGKDEVTREIENRSKKTKEPAHPGNGSPKTAEEAFDHAVMNLPPHRR